MANKVPSATTQPEKAVEAEKTAPADTSNHQSGVLIQAGAFRTDALADSQMAKVSLLGLPAQVVRVKDANGNVMRIVRSRERLKQAEAEEVVGRLSRHNVQTLLID